eukprot:TRINITY_DN1368_c0_g1_i1.p1 TRINITY_DN1368_c0_g1~~TRINITY_DN1368_c0_g1_i1.p1  ORF type:complete len:464 (+),score=23.62 TRINITY_DN1368_c0_g1_i1:2566-3957(+)
MAVYITNGQEVVQFQTGISKQPRQYTTCDAQLDQKPIVRLNKRTRPQIESLCRSIHTGNLIDMHDYVSVLCFLMQKFLTAECETTFTTCGFTIAEEGETITPCDFVQLEYTQGNPPDVDATSSMTIESEQKELLAKMLAVNRHDAAIAVVGADASYASRVADQMIAAFAKAGVSTTSVTLGNSARFSVTIPYTRLLCAADMFFVKFPRHDLASLKVGTLTMAFKDMAQCNNVAYLHTLTGQPWTTLAFYTFERMLINEMMQIRCGEYWNEAYYFPYQSSMDLLNGKYTYYSNTKNPKFHTVVQILGMIAGQDRAFNARCIETPTATLVGQAIIYQMATSGESGYGKAVYAAEEDAAAFNNVQDADDPPSVRAGTFLTLLPDNAKYFRKVGQRSLTSAQERAETMNVRDGSFGAWIKTANISSLCREYSQRMKKANSSPEEDDSDDDDDETGSYVSISAAEDEP